MKKVSVICLVAQFVVTIDKKQLVERLLYARRLFSRRRESKDKAFVNVINSSGVLKKNDL
jgi:hypothetical protein